MTAAELDELVAALLSGRGFAHKSDIADVMDALSVTEALIPHTDASVAIGDDCAAIPDGDGWLLLAIEGFVEDFVNQMPWLAGYSGVVVNVSDIAAMGGRPIAVVDALWSRGMTPAREVLQGLTEASLRYGVPVVGGHTNHRSDRGQLAVAILGRARKLLSSFDAVPGDALIMAVDLRGKFEGDQPYWNASTDAPAERLRADLDLLAQIAESDLSKAAKDISMAGVVGTALMLAECSRVGIEVDIDAIPRPQGVSLLRWLQAFPSYGFLLSVAPANIAAVVDTFSTRGLAAAVIGNVNAGSELTLASVDASSTVWDWKQRKFISGRQPSAGHADAV
ncbi:MAG: hypothetical protein RL678_822 [Pseudomonadota bacterium]|jgi:AIR synthase-related protein